MTETSLADQPTRGKVRCHPREAQRRRHTHRQHFWLCFLYLASFGSSAPSTCSRCQVTYLRIITTVCCTIIVLLLVYDLKLASQENIERPIWLFRERFIMAHGVCFLKTRPCVFFFLLRTFMPVIMVFREVRTGCKNCRPFILYY